MSGQQHPWPMRENGSVERPTRPDKHAADRAHSPSVCVSSRSATRSGQGIFSATSPHLLPRAPSDSPWSKRLSRRASGFKALVGHRSVLGLATRSGKRSHRMRHSENPCGRPLGQVGRSAKRLTSSPEVQLPRASRLSLALAELLLAAPVTAGSELLAVDPRVVGAVARLASRPAYSSGC